MVLELLQDMLINNQLIAAEHKAGVAIIKQLETGEIDEKHEELRLLLNPIHVCSSNDQRSSVFVVNE
jgi:hypothetical protein